MHEEITTVIPTYRRPGLLVRAIKSVLAQTYPHFQVHVYDNASGDETADVVSRIADSRVKYHVHSHNIGRLRNYEYGIAHAQTPLLHILSDDDVILPEFYETAVSALKSEPQAGFFMAGTLYSDFEGNVVGESFERWNAEGILGPVQLFNLLLRRPGSWIGWHATIFRTEILPKIGGFEPAHFGAEDVDMMLRGALSYPAVVCRRPCAVWVVHEGQATNTEAPPCLGDIFAFPLLPGVENAIAAAEASGTITLDDAERMRLRFRTAVERSLFLRALKFLARHDTTTTHTQHQVLRQTLRTRAFSDILQVATSAAPAGRLSRAALRIAYKIHQIALRSRAKHGYQQYTELVKRTFRQLADEDSNCSDIHPPVSHSTDGVSDPPTYRQQTFR